MRSSVFASVKGGKVCESCVMALSTSEIYVHGSWVIWTVHMTSALAGSKYLSLVCLYELTRGKNSLHQMRSLVFPVLRIYLEHQGDAPSI
jgi:hypothetical protein